MGKRQCMGIQQRWDNGRKFDLVLVKDTPFTDEEALWAAFVFSKTHYGVLPETWQRFGWDTEMGWSDLVWVPKEHVIEYDSSGFVLGETNKFAELVIEAYRLHSDAMEKAKRMVYLYVQEQMLEKYGDVALNLPEPTQTDNSRLWTLSVLMGRQK